MTFNLSWRGVNDFYFLSFAFTEHSFFLVVFIGDMYVDGELVLLATPFVDECTHSRHEYLSVADRIGR